MTHRGDSPSGAEWGRLTRALAAFAGVSLLALSQPCAAESAPRDSCDDVSAIYVLLDDRAIVYKTFGHFIELRKLLCDGVRPLAEVKDAYPAPIYEMKLAERGTILVGKDWIGDGVGIASISPQTFQHIKKLIDDRTDAALPLSRIKRQCDEASYSMHLWPHTVCAAASERMQ
ncbi:MAG: hypothetical protein AB1651_06800 [Pseudomonadota bacterium]